MNIIFLDVYGVLNSVNKLIKVYNETRKPHSGYSYPFDEKCLEYLKILVQKTNSKLVITSSWRKSYIGIDTLMNVLKDYDLDTEVIGFTPILNQKKELEIKEFLSCYEQVINFIILDDVDDFDELIPYVIKTNPQFGLSLENVDESIKKLNRTLRL